MKVPFPELDGADLRVEAVYKGDTALGMAGEPLAKLLPVGNQGGFRAHGSPRKGGVKLAVLFTTGRDPDWPDALDPQTGHFTYWGDNKTPGTPLHATMRGGNVLLRDVFDWKSRGANERQRIPPFLVFDRAGTGRDVRFRGLAVPGAVDVSSDDELVAVWRTTRGQRFQNYRALFTVLDVAVVERQWINNVLANRPWDNAPPAWQRWIRHGTYRPLIAAKTTVIRVPSEQLPVDEAGHRMLAEIRGFFASAPTEFEYCAVALWRLYAPATGRCEITRRSRDGGADAWGTYHLGPSPDPVAVEFALEAKCWGADNAVGVRETSRLISRIRHRQFGVFITTSHFNRQAYEEVRGDGHPVVLICGSDIVELLTRHGYGSPALVRQWLEENFS